MVMLRKQRLIFGIAAPLISALINPRGFHGGPLFMLLGSAEWFAPFIFFMFAVGCGATLGSMFLGNKQRWSEVLAGMLLAAAAGAAIAIALLLPAIVVHTIYAPWLIVFAATPPLAGFIWLRTGLALLRHTAPVEPVVARWGAIQAFFICLFSGFATMALAALLVTQALQSLANANPDDAKRAAQVISNAPWCIDVCNESLWRAYHSTEDAERHHLIDDLYHQRTGYGINETNRQGYW